MRVCSLLSGGKDSNYSLYRAIVEGHSVECIIVVHPERDDSWMFHAFHTSAAVLQAESMGFSDRVYEVRVSGVKEREVEELEEALSRLYYRVGFDALTVGSLASRYQRSRLESLSEKIGFSLYSPFWGLDPVEYMYRLVGEGIVFIIVSISTMGLPRELLGVPASKALVERIVELSRRHGFHPAFEGGEAETLVVDAPHYSRPLCVRGVRVSRGDFHHFITIEELKLGSKGLDCVDVR